MTFSKHAISVLICILAGIITWNVSMHCMKQALRDEKTNTVQKTTFAGLLFMRLADSLERAEEERRHEALSAGYQNSLFFQMGLGEFSFHYSPNTFKIHLNPVIRGRIAQYDEFGNRTIIKPPPPPTKSDEVKAILEGRNHSNFVFIF